MRFRTVRRFSVCVVAAVVALASASCSNSSDDDSKGIPENYVAFDVGDLDTAIDPCTDFNEFVNSKWLNATEIPADDAGVGIGNVLQDESDALQKEIAESAVADLDSEDKSSDRYLIGAMYKSALDEDVINARGFDPIKAELAKVDAIDSREDIVSFLNQDAADASFLMFTFGSGPDFRDAARQIGYVYSGGVRLPTKDYYTNPDYANILGAYRSYLEKELQLVDVPEAEAKAQADRALAFESELAATTLSPEEGRKPENQYKLLTVAEANAVTPAFDWRKYLDAQQMQSVTSFSLSETAFFTKFNELLERGDLDQWKAYLRTQVISKAAPRLTQQFRDNEFELGKLLTGQTEQRPRWEIALAATNTSIGEALGRLWVEQKFDEDAKARAEELVRNILDAMKVRIEQIDWMSPETKAKALEKWDAILPKIGYPDNWRDWSGLELDPGTYFENRQAADVYNNAYDLAKIGKPTDRKEWFTTPQTVNAFYSPTNNTINFPAGILQPPYFDANADDALNYGGIGAIIGHEITHGFDDQGSQFDGAGNNVEWWTENDRALFTEKTDKLVTQFDEYTPIPSKPDLHVNGRLTLGENIADLGGLNAAYDAFQKVLAADPEEADEKIDGYTPDQRFFLSYARSWRGKVRPEVAETLINSDSHSPDALRINGVVPNVTGFAEAFTCAPGTPMAFTDDKRVVVW
ncbi:M13 family metallopeptidase [Antrihabitans sp. YC2-6]|uniref:M13 family metallopeptidase n=1 Tax=Antrihabitans sp. YC2-6 TaxID=2799498 RepID=UPI0018F5194A|nr:M13 family metallopeptidase [Antrihabitans sp. YC2-6]MBJ8343128.1 M13 family metallopeptidase [Antrihabitans sp. YC2-6]